MATSADSSIRAIRKRILIPIISSILGLLVIISLIEDMLHGSIQEDEILKSTDSIQKGFNQLLNDSADSMTGLIRIIAKDIELQSAWLNQDRYLLNKLSDPVFKSLNQQFGITHFYFHGIDGINFLRVHDPDSYGDRISRKSFQIAEREQRMGIGLEIGVKGDLVMRVVHPWRIAGQLHGYIELGREIDEITSDLNRMFNINLVTLFEKQYVNKDHFIDNPRFQTGWNRYSKFLLVNEAEGSLESKIITDQLLSTVSTPGKTVRIPFGEQIFLSSAMPIIDADKNQVALLLLLEDISKEVKSSHLLFLSETITGIAIGILLFLAFYLYIGKIQRELNSTHSNLINEIDIHKQTEQKLFIKTQELTERNQELESYSYSIAHDLRAPLRSIVGFSQIVLEDNEGDLDEVTERHLERIVNSGKRMSLIIDEILELSRISRCKIEIKKVNVSEVARKILNKALNSDNYEHTDFNIQDNLIVQADPRLMHILLSNLIDNALKYSQHEEEPFIEIGRTERDGKAVIYIKDNGIGFDMQYNDKIFSAFQRLHGEEYEGTGIGLATVQRILNRHGEKIWAESTPGEGATFYFTANFTE